MKRLLSITSGIAAVLLVGGIVNASAADWLGTSSPSWNDPLNWQGSVVPDAFGAGIFMVGNGSTTFTATITNDVTGRPSEIVMGGFGSTARVDHRAGTLGTQNPGWPPGWMLLGFSGNGNATYNLADTTTTGGTFTGYGTGSGTLNIVDNLFMGEPGGGGDGTGISTLNINTTGALTIKGDIILGISGWNATVNLDAGAFRSTNGWGWIRIPRGAGNNTNTTTSGTLNQAGGSVDSNYGIQVGGDPGQTSYTNLVGTVNLNGGTMATHGPDWWDDGVWIGCGGTGTFNLNGGTLTTTHVLHEGTTGTSFFNFNGGTLKASGSRNAPWDSFFGGNPNYLADGRSFTAAYVQAGGAIIDTAGFDNYFGQALLTGTNITDGGLTKNGNGQLEIGGANTFTGPVVVNGGTLYANAGSGPNNRSFSFASSITVNSNATLRATGNSLFGWDGSQAKPITVNAGGTATAENGDQNIGLVTLAGGTLASVNPDGFWGSWHFGRASVKNLLVTSNSTASAGHVAFTAGATIEVASGKTLNFTGFIGDGGGDGPTTVIKEGAGTLLLAGANTYTGNTTINAGTLALSGSGSLATPKIILANGAKYDVSGLSTAFALGSGQTMTNISGTGLVAGNINLASGALALNYTNGTPSLSLTNGTLTFAGNAVTVNVAGSLPHGIYKLISTNSGGLVSVTLPSSVTVNGIGTASGSLSLSNGELYLTVNHPPVAGNVSYVRNAGINLLRITISNLLTNVTDADSDTITLVSVGTSSNGIIPTVSGGLIGYYNTNNVADQFSYTITDGFGGTNTGVVSIVVSNAATGQITGQFTSFTGGVANLTFHGIPNYSYITERSTNLTDWVDVVTNSAGINGVISVTDSFGNLGGVPPASAYYRLKWQP